MRTTRRRRTPATLADLQLKPKLEKVREWLDHGEVQHARTVFDEVPSEVVEREEDLKILQWRLQDAEEAVALGESVYPSSTPPSSRWTAPQIPPGEGLMSWSPGRVVSANKHAVAVVIATVRDGKPQKQVVESRITAKQWVAAGGGVLPLRRMASSSCTSRRRAGSASSQ